MKFWTTYMIVALLGAFLTGCGGGSGGGSGPSFPPQGSQIVASNPFLEATILDGGNLLVPHGWMDFSLSDGNQLVGGTTIRIEQCDGAGGGPGLVRTHILTGSETSYRFAPYAPLTSGQPGFCGLTRSQLFDELPGTQETKWTVTMTVPSSWYTSKGYTAPFVGTEWSRSYTFYLVPEELEARGPKFHRVTGGLPEPGVFWHVWDIDAGDKITTNAAAHFYVANDSGDANRDWVAQVPQTHENIMGQYGTPWYQSTLVDGLTGDFLMYPDPNHSSVIVVRDEIGRYSRPVLIRTGDECQPLLNYIPLSEASGGWQDIVVDLQTGGQLFYLADAPPGYSYSNAEVLVRNVVSKSTDFVQVSQNVATWTPPVPNPGQVIVYDVHIQTWVDVPMGSNCNAGFRKSEPYRFLLIGQ